MPTSQPSFYGVPRVASQILSRSRLCERLDQPAALTVVRGPAGAGKTTAVADWVRHRFADAIEVPGAGAAGTVEMAGAWVGLDKIAPVAADAARSSPEQHASSSSGPDDDDGIWRELVLAVADAGWTEETPAELIGELSAGTAGDRLLVRLLRRLDGQRVLVLDNADFLERRLQQRILAMLTECPRLRCVLLTRQSNFSVLNAELMIDTTLIDADELMLTEEEMQQLLTPALTAGRSAAAELDPDGLREIAEQQHSAPALTATDLTEHVGRLPVTVRAATLALQRLAEDPDDDPRPLGRLVDPAGPGLSSTVLTMIITACRELLLDRGRDQEFADFLLSTSVAAELPVDLASELSGVVDSRAMLQRAQREGLGGWLSATAGYAEETVFGYSTAVRAVLRQDLARQDPARLTALKRIYGRWADGHAWTSAAFRCWIELGDYASANRVAQRAVTDLLQTDAAGVIRLLDDVGLPRLREYPVLIFLLAAAYDYRNESWSRTTDMLKAAIGSIRRQLKQASAPERFLLHTLDSAAHRMLGRPDASVAAADQALSLLEQLPVRQRDALNGLAPAALSQATFGYLRAGRLDRAQHSLCTTYALTGTGPRAGQELAAAGQAAAVQAIRGDIPGAAKIVCRINRTWPADRVDDHRGAMVRVARMIIALERLDLECAEEQVDALAASYDRLEMWAPYAIGRGMIAIGRGEAAIAYEHLHATLNSPDAARLGTAEQQAIEAVMALALYGANRPQRADQLLPRGGNQPIAIYVRAIAALTFDDPEQALISANQVLAGVPSSDPVRQTRWSANAGLIRAAALARLGNKVAACTEATDATAELDRSGRRLPLMLLPRADLEQLSDIAAAEGSTGVLRVFGNLDDIPDVLSGIRPPVSLTQREQVVLNVLARTGSVASIGQELKVSPNTVKTQLRAIYRKLGVGSRTDALLAASEQELLSR